MKIHYVSIAVVILLGCSTQKKLLTNNQLLITPIKIDASTSKQGPCEPTICINPNNSNQILGGSILNRIYISNDAGRTWEHSRLYSSHGVYGDPVITANYKGDFFYAHLSNPEGKAYASESFLDRIVVQKSSDGGHTWNDGSYSLPRSPKDQDKEWLAIDPENNNIYMTWTEFDLYNSSDVDHQSRILFSKSTDDGQSWTDPITLSQYEGDCIDNDNTTEGAVPAVGPDGEIYVAWSYAEKIYFDRSYDAGTTWLDQDRIVTDQPGGWTFDIPGLSRCNGMPITCADLSPSKHNGRVYVNWGDQRHGSDDTDIWIAYSDDRGDTWSDPIRVNNDDKGAHQFLSWMDIDNSTGYIYIVFYDRRGLSDNATDVYLAVSKDGGHSFSNHKLNRRSFTPTPDVFFGDYNDISVVNGVARPIWTELTSQEISVWTAIIEGL